MHRFYLPPEECESVLLSLSEADAHHARSVLRLLKAEEVQVLNGVGKILTCRVSEVTKKQVILEKVRIDSLPALPCSVVLYQALPKARLIEDIIQKATELGIRKIVPVLSERVVSRLDEVEAIQKQSKWQHVAVEAIKQCGSPWLPSVTKPASIDAILRETERCEFEVIGALEASPWHLKLAIRKFLDKAQKPPASAGFWVGPEGDFTDEERAKIKNAGALPVTLGSLVLRCETAAIYGLSVLNHEFQG